MSSAIEVNELFYPAAVRGTPFFRLGELTGMLASRSRTSMLFPGRLRALNPVRRFGFRVWLVPIDVRVGSRVDEEFRLPIARRTN